MTHPHHPANPRTQRVARVIRWMLMTAASAALLLLALHMLDVRLSDIGVLRSFASGALISAAVLLALHA